MSSTPVVVCLGLGLLPDSSMPEMLVERCKVAADLSKERELQVINSGGDPKKTGVTEAQVMTDFMLDSQDMSEENIFKEEKSLSTWTNAVHVHEIMSKNPSWIRKLKTTKLIISFKERLLLQKRPKMA